MDKDLTSMFIQFAEEYFTDSAADRLHNPTVKSCLVRNPGSINSKCITQGEDAEVKIIQRWNAVRPLSSLCLHLSKYGLLERELMKR